MLVPLRRVERFLLLALGSCACNSSPPTAAPATLPRALATYPEPWDPSTPLRREAFETRTMFVIAKRSALCPTRDGAEARECGNSKEDTTKGLALGHGETVNVVGDAPFDGHWRAIREQVDGPLPGWVRADDLAARPSMESLDRFDARADVATAMPVDGLTSEEIHALPPGTLVRWTRKRGPLLASIRRLDPADPDRSVVIYVTTKDGKPVVIDFPEDPVTGGFRDQVCFDYGDCAALHICEEGGHCDALSLLARTTSRRASPPEVDEDLDHEPWQKQWEGYSMPVLQGIVLADRFGLWELDEPSG
jgi:hypothetical protein